MHREKIFSKRHKNRDDLAGEHKLGDLGQLILLFLFLAAVISDKCLFRISDQLLGYVSSWVRIPLGATFVLLGGILAKNGLKIVFGETRQKSSVIKKGVFALVRHPIYLGSILTYLGFLIFSCSILGLAVFVVIILFYYFISRYEEELLLQRFGDAYREYMENVPMWVPRLVKR